MRSQVFQLVYLFQQVEVIRIYDSYRFYNFYFTLKLSHYLFVALENIY